MFINMDEHVSELASLMPHNVAKKNYVSKAYFLTQENHMVWCKVQKTEYKTVMMSDIYKYPFKSSKRKDEKKG